MRKFFKFLAGAASMAAIAGGALYLFKKYNDSDSFDDFDEDDDFDDFDDFDDDSVVDIDVDQSESEADENAATEA